MCAVVWGCSRHTQSHTLAAHTHTAVTLFSRPITSCSWQRQAPLLTAVEQLTMEHFRCTEVAAWNESWLFFWVFQWLANLMVKTTTGFGGLVVNVSHTLNTCELFSDTSVAKGSRISPNCTGTNTTTHYIVNTQGPLMMSQGPIRYSH